LALLLGDIKGGVIAETDFEKQWRDKFGADLVLPSGVTLSAFLKDAEAAGACRLEMRHMHNATDLLFVHAARPAIKSMVPLPEMQWFYFCSEMGLGPAMDGFQPYDYDQTQQIEAAWAAYIDGSGSSKLEIQGDAGGVKSDSKFGNKYAIYFQPQSSDCYQENTKSKFKRELKREKCVLPPPLCQEQVFEVAPAGSVGDLGRLHISRDALSVAPRSGSCVVS